jgi:hypothetical protein
MARGGRPKSPFLKLVTGNPGKRPIPKDPAVALGSRGPVVPPVELRARQLELWNQFVRDAPWLTAHDATTALVWVELYSEFERDPGAMVAGKIAQLRAAATEIGLGGPGSRLKFAVDGTHEKDDPAASYFAG